MSTPDHTGTIEPVVAQHRKSEYDVNPVFLNRWSPRAYLTKEIPTDTLYTVFEAARWAPSAANEQPWRFVVARTETDRQKFQTFIHPRNVEWCQHAPVLAVITSRNITSRGTEYAVHSFDAGAAWGMLAIQATMLGLYTHAMGGFDRAKAREVLNLPTEYEPHIVISLGYLGDKSQLAEDFQAREIPSGRLSLGEILFEGTFGDPMVH